MEENKNLTRFLIAFSSTSEIESYSRFAIFEVRFG
jgi:hypothetical protein